VAQEKRSNKNTTEREFGSEADVERITGRKRRTLQKDRFFGRGFPFYRVAGQVLYDLNEVREIVRAGRVDTVLQPRTPRGRRPSCVIIDHDAADGMRRLNDLRHKGLTEKYGERACSTNGNDMAVWRATSGV
jgi:hypothetical protein